MLAENRRFARELDRLGIGSHYAVIRGGHDWALWRAQAAKALYAASVHLVMPGATAKPGPSGHA